MGNGMRVLKILTVVMGVMILAGTAVIIAVIFHRATTSGGAAAPVALMLDQPPGTHIVGLAATQDRLAVQLQGGGADRVVLIDPRAGSVTGRITLTH